MIQKKLFQIYAQTLILRFRDLVTETGETIVQHNKIIKEKGFVWWAWWKKGHEITPTNEFGGFSIKAKEHKLTIYLIDSGQEKLYKATCIDIKCTEDSPNMSPEPDCTPEYYSNNLYYAWFKLISITECEINEVRRYSYLNNDSLFKEGTSNYNLFYDKIIFNISELIQQNRTIWFVRNFQEGDKENEIVLLNANVVQPHVFSEEYKGLNGSTFLWLSDLHFSNGELSVKNTPNKESLVNHIKHCCTETSIFSDISGLIITGDITDCGKKEGFDIAIDFITDINRESSFILDSDNIIFCPGNHDLKEKKECLGKGVVPALSSDDKDTSLYFSEFYKDVYHIKPNKYLASGRKILTRSGKTVEFAALNSLLLQQYSNFEGHGFISQEQLDFVESSMKWNEGGNNSSYRIAIMHHHYCPSCLSEKIDVTKPSSIVYDADRLMKWLVKNNVKLLLHGHKHNTFLSKISYPKNSITLDVKDMHDIFVISFGGTGAKDVLLC